MKKAISAALATLALVAVFGCGGRPDPKENPEFNNETYSDPNAVLNTMQTPGKK